MNMYNTTDSTQTQLHSPTSLQANPIKSGTENSLASDSGLPYSTYTKETGDPHKQYILNDSNTHMLQLDNKAAFTLKRFRQKRIDTCNSFLAVAFCPVYTAPFCQRKPIKQMECGRGILRRAHMYVLVRTMRQRKRNFFLIDVVVGLLVAFSASMKA